MMHGNSRFIIQFPRFLLIRQEQDHGTSCVLPFLTLLCRSVQGWGRIALYLETEKDFLQRTVTWDSHSFFIRGERLLLYSSDFHPFQLLVLGLRLDIFSNAKALGFNTAASIHLLGLLEENRDESLMMGFEALMNFFERRLKRASI